MRVITLYSRRANLSRRCRALLAACFALTLLNACSPEVESPEVEGPDAEHQDPVSKTSDTGVAIGALEASGFTENEDMFQQPYIDQDEWREEPVKHRYVHGGFTGTDTRFSFYFPDAEQYQGRFFQYITPVPDSENLSQGQTGESDKIGFAIDSGAYFIETNGGGARQMQPGNDATIGAFRANAAAAQFSRHLAEQIYDSGRPYGYAFGGSGGGYRTLAGMENTDGVWDGAVPFVIGTPMSLPNIFTVRTYAMRVLGDDLPEVADALDVGSNRTPADFLDEEQQGALDEVTGMGFPPAGWQLHEHLGLHAFAVIYPIVAMIDPQYFEDFWNLPGYEGHDGSESLEKSKVQQQVGIAETLTLKEARERGLDVSSIAGAPKGRADDAWQTQQNQSTSEATVAVKLDTSIPQSILGADMKADTGAAQGNSMVIARTRGDYVLLDGRNAALFADIKVGDKVTIDNLRFLAVQTYHRHQVPGPEYKVWDQFRDADGEPMYPQRRILGPMLSKGATGVPQTGAFNGKMIVVENLHDTEAFPWQADWYRQQVQKHLGDATDDHLRVWMIDHANHGDFTVQKEPTHTVSYLGVLQQALRDLSAWVEDGKAPAPSTHYNVVNGQVVVPADASERQGIQPVVSLNANGASRADVSTDEPLMLEARIDVPDNTGSIVSVEWDLDGSGDFATQANLNDADTQNGQLIVTKEVSFSEPGTHFVTVRVASQRDGDADTPFARIQNLGRARIVVE